MLFVEDIGLFTCCFSYPTASSFVFCLALFAGLPLSRIAVALRVKIFSLYGQIVFVSSCSSRFFSVPLFLSCVPLSSPPRQVDSPKKESLLSYYVGVFFSITLALRFFFLQNLGNGTSRPLSRADGYLPRLFALGHHDLESVPMFNPATPCTAAGLFPTRSRHGRPFSFR